MKRHHGVVAVLLAFLLVAPALRAQDMDDAAKEKKVRKLLKLSGELTAARTACRDALKKQAKSSSLPPGYVKKFSELADEEFFGDVFTPVYMKHFDEGDIDGLIAFYETPAGRKLVRERIGLQKDAMEAAMTAGGQLGLRVMKELRKAQDEGDDDDAPKKDAPRKDAKPDEGEKGEKAPAPKKPSEDPGPQ